MSTRTSSMTRSAFGRALRSKASPWLAAGALAVALVGAGVHLTHGAASTAPPRAEAKTSAGVPADKSGGADAVMTVTAARVRTDTWPRWTLAQGNVEPWQQASIATVIGGLRVVAIQAEVGDSVRRGDVLASFDLEALHAERAGLQADVAQASVQAERARAELRRADGLREGGAVSDHDWLLSKTQAAATEAQLSAATARLQAKEVALRQAVVVAPDDGVITARYATVGAVEPSGKELFRMNRRGRLRWLAEITPDQMAQVKVGQAVEASLPAGGIAAGRIVRLAPELSTTSRMAIAYADLDDGSLASGGMYLEGRILMAGARALIIPARAVLVRDGHSLVAVIQGEAATAPVELRRIVAGRRMGDAIEAVSGLSAGERVVVGGVDFLGDGDRVAVVEGPDGQAARGEAR